MEKIKLENVILGDLSEFINSMNKKFPLYEGQEYTDENILDILIGTNRSEIEKLLSKTGKSLSEIIESDTLTLTEINVIFEISKINNYSVYTEIKNKILDSEEYKNKIIEVFNTSLDEFTQKMMSNEKISKIDYSNKVKKFTESFSMLIGSDFENSEKIILDYYDSKIKDIWDDYDLNEVSNEYLKHFSDSTDFYTFTTNQPNYSGWKIYIYGDNKNDIIEILQSAGPYIKSLDFPFKVATNKGLTNKDGKGLIIYLPYNTIINKEFKTVFDDLLTKLSNYKNNGQISGSKNYSGPLYYSYEFKVAFRKLPKGGVKYSELNKYYVPNVGGDYMKGIKQKDLFDNE